jgi:hypothetical protein
MKKCALFLFLFILVANQAYSLGFPPKLYPSKVFKKVGTQIFKKLPKIK